MTTWAEYKTQAEQFRKQEIDATAQAQQTEIAAMSSPNPGENQAAALAWIYAAGAAMSIDGVRKKYLAEGVEGTVMPWPAPSTPWKAGTKSGAAQLDPNHPLVASQIVATAAGGKSAAERAWYYGKQYAFLHQVAAEKKGAPQPPTSGPQSEPAKPPVLVDQGVFEAITAKRPIDKPAPRPGGATVPGDPVLVDPTTGTQLDPSTGAPVEQPGSATLLWIAGGVAAGYALLKWLARRR